MALRSSVEGWTNAEEVPEAISRCVSFRLRGEPLYNFSYDDIMKDVLESVRAPF